MAGLALLLAGLSELPRGVGVARGVGVEEGERFKGRLKGGASLGEGENRSFFVGVASKIGVLLSVGVASAEGDFLFLLVGVESVSGDLSGVVECFLGVGDWCSLGGVMGCLRGDLRLVGVTCEVGRVTRTTLSGREDAVGERECGGV